MNQINLLEPRPPKPKRERKPELVRDPNAFYMKEYKVVTLRESPAPEKQFLVDTPDRVADYWRTHIATSPFFRGEVESFVVLLVNTRRRAIGHSLVSAGTLVTILVHPREVFRTTIVMSAAAMILAYKIYAATHKLCYVKRAFMCRGE
jgi:hypothetical protein